jgi:hypothetical protein
MDITSNGVQSHPWPLEADQLADLEDWIARQTGAQDHGRIPALCATRPEGACAEAAPALNLDHSYIRCTEPQEPLEIPAFSDPPGGGAWYVQQKTVDNYAEFVAIEDPEHDLLRRSHGGDDKVKREVVDQPELPIDFAELERRNEVAARRSKRGLKWAVLGLGGDRIWTLTARGRIENYSQAWALWSQFEQSCSRRFANFKCVAVVEPHTLDGFHIHFVTNKFFDVSSMRLWWHRILTGRKLKGILRGEDSPGNIEVGKPHGARKIGKYLSKYLGKSFASLQAVRIKRFAASKGIRAPIVTRTRMPSCIGGEVYRLRRRAEADGWKVEAIFEGSIMGRRLIWMQCARKKHDPPSMLRK